MDRGQPLGGELIEIVGRSIKVSLTATAVACAIGLPLGAMLAVTRFPGRKVVLIVVNALMGLPPVVVGLIVYLHLSRADRGVSGAALHAGGDDHCADDPDHGDRRGPFAAGHGRSAHLVRRAVPVALPRSLTGGTGAAVGRAFLVADVGLAGRAVAEVGAVIVVGGNIGHLARVTTTAIALETSKDDLALALGSC